MGKTLFDHAVFELKKFAELADGTIEDKKIITDTLALVKRFERQGHSKHTGKWTLDFFETVAQGLPLTPLTDDPAEWEAYEDTHKNLKTGNTDVVIRWQNKRVPSVISMDEGKTFVDMSTGKEGESVDHVKQSELWAQQRAEREAAKKAAEEQAQADAKAPETDTSVPAGEDSTVAESTVSQQRRIEASKEGEK